MGEYEELVDRALNGDAEAAEALKSKYSGTNLREQADAATKKLKEQEPLVRVGKFNEAWQNLAEELKESGLTVDDFKDTAPDELTAELVAERAKSRVETKSAQETELAKSYGFETVEELQEMLKAAGKEKIVTTEKMESIGGAASSSSGESTGSDDPEPFDAMKADWKEAKTRGLSDDKAMGEAIHGLLAAQAPVDN